jgi:two-component system, cell cycle sensor histidine kinase and response regulator CckA
MQLTVLVVDDEELLRRFMAQAMAADGYRVLEASNGVEALAWFQNGAPPIHLVVTDILMPDMDGVELAARLATRSPPPPVLFVTGGHGHSTLPGPVLLKPFLRSDLSAVVRRLLDYCFDQGPSDEGADAKTARFTRRSAPPGVTC